MLLKENLTPEELKTVDAARRKAFLLYEGKVTPHRSCGIAVAETFGLPTRPYQALRKGGLTGEGECGAIKAGELVLGEFLGDPSPTGPPTPILKEAAQLYREEWIRRVNLVAQEGGTSPDRESPAPASGKSQASSVSSGGEGKPVNINIFCNHLIAPLGSFDGPDRKAFCTNIASQVAEIVAEILLKAGIVLEIHPIESHSP